MKARVPPLLALLLLASLPPAPVPTAPLIRLGYGPGILFDPSQGVPIYTMHDELWLASTTGAEAHLYPPGSTLPLKVRTLEAGVPIRLHRFMEGEPLGLWTLRVSAGEGWFEARLPLVDPSREGVILSLEGYRLLNGGLLLSLGLEPGGAYEIEYCAVNIASSGLLYLPIPEPLGSGRLRVQLSDGLLSLAPEGVVASPFTLWLTLHHPYSLATAGLRGYISGDLQVAESGRLHISPETREASAAIKALASLRPGRYTLRAFYKSLRGLEVHETRLLHTTPEGWIWAAACRPTPAQGPTIGIFTGLEGPVDQWPTHLYLVYRVSGVEHYTSLPLNLGLARVTFMATPWRARLTDLEVSITPHPAVEQHHYSEGGLHLIGREFPLELQYLVSLGGRTVKSGTLRLERPYTETTVSVETGRLVVSVKLKGEPVPDATVRVRGEAGGVALKTTDSQGVAAFHLPEGEYRVEVIQGAQAVGAAVRVSLGEAVELPIELAPEAAPPLLLWGLTATALLGLALNIWVWVVRPRRFQGPSGETSSYKAARWAGGEGG